MSDAPAEVLPLGDSALLIRLDPRTARERAAQALAAELLRNPAPGVHDVSIAYDTVAIYFDPLATEYEVVARDALDRVPSLPSAERLQGASRTIKVVYDGPDLDEVAARTVLTRDEVIRLHSAPEYEVHAVGFVPGFAYLGDIDERLVLPRRSAPRPRVPAGSVAIAGRQTAVYPFATPGGWHLIGRTEEKMFDPTRTPPSLLSAGARVRFEPA